MFPRRPSLRLQWPADGRRRPSAPSWCVAAIGLLLVMLPPAAATAGDSLRCRSRLVAIGDGPGRIRELCGPPEDIYTEERYPDARISTYVYDPYGHPQRPYLVSGPVHYERWTYDFGTNRLPYYLHFENARLIRIETGRRP